MLSVFDTLKETLFLWVRNFWYLAVLTLAIRMPEAFLMRFPSGSSLLHPSAYIFILEFVKILGSLLLEAIYAAAVLGFFTKVSLGKLAWRTMLYNIKNYTWTLFRLSILIGLIAMLLAIPVSFVMLKVGTGRFGMVFVTGLYLLLIKYALADPLVVVENRSALDALKRSWRMTKGHYWYVLGCYLALASGGWFIHWAITTPVGSSNFGSSWAWFPIPYAVNLYDSLWLVLSWRMYLRIKEADAPLSSEAVPN